MIHTFRLLGRFFILDVYSGAVHVADKLFCELAEAVQALSGPVPDRRKEAFGALSDRYPPSELDEAWEELLELVEAGALFSGDEYAPLAEGLSVSPVKAMCLNVSHDCNLRCEYCFAAQGGYAGGRALMSLETGRRAIDFLLEQSAGRENLEVDFFGGEPLMNFDVVRGIVEYARSREKECAKRFRFTVTTNGLLLDDEKIDYINREMSNVVLSLDGRKTVNDRVRARVNGTGSYDAVTPKFQRLVQRRGDLDYYVRGTFTAYNKDFASDAAALNALGFDQISLEPAVGPADAPWALTEADLPELFAEYERLADLVLDAKRNGGSFNFFHFMLDLEQGPCAVKRLRGCGCGNEYVAVTPDGSIYPCHQFVGHEQWRMGSLYDGSFDLSMKEKFAKSTVYHKPECTGCWAKFYCSGGCGASNMQYMGDVLQPLPMTCALEKKRLECAVAIRAELTLQEESQ